MGWGAFAIFLLALATRLPFRTEHLWSHDAVLYARAVADFDPSAQRPQPPGYLWYVLLVRGVTAVTGDPNAAMTLVSAVAAAVAVALLFVLGARMYGTRTGLAAAALLLTSVTFWGESAVAYPYTLLAALSVLVALLLWRALADPAARPRHLVAASAAWGVAMGFRLDLVAIAPLWLLVALEVRWRWRVAAAAAAAVPVALWIVASGVATGDVGRFVAAVREQSALVTERYGVAGRGAEALAANTRELARYLGRALYAAVPLLAAWLVLFAARRERADRRAAFLLAWTLPPVPFFLLVHVGEYGYVFGILPGLCVLVARGAALIAERLRAPRLALALTGAAVAANAGIFLFTDTPLSAGDLARRDGGIGEKIGYLERTMDPARTIIAAAYDTVIVEHYLGGRFAIVGFDPQQATTVRELCPRGCRGITTVVWDDLVRPVGERWRSVTLPSGAVLRIAEMRGRGWLRAQGMAVHLDDAAD